MCVFDDGHFRMCAKFTCDGKRGFKQDTCYLFIHNSVSFLFLAFHYFKITRAVHSINLSIAELGEKLKNKICAIAQWKTTARSQVFKCGSYAFIYVVWLRC